MVFVDVRGFTSLSEKLSPGELARVMNGFYNASSGVVLRLDGTVDKFVGDQIMAFFGAPFEPRKHTARAVEAAREIVKATTKISNVLRVGGAVSTGMAFVGNVGGAAAGRSRPRRGAADR